ncbi:MAG: RNA methyltransferase [Chloroflexi bacterium]|nr:RNA methyltransferase [Chloroflexota bacterium]
MVLRPFPSTPTLVLVLDGVANPGNLGTMLRTAAAAGVDGVLLGPGCVDPFNPKVLRGSMGAICACQFEIWLGPKWPSAGRVGGVVD